MAAKKVLYKVETIKFYIMKVIKVSQNKGGNNGFTIKELLEQ